jgi:hypothetical protein
MGQAKAAKPQTPARQTPVRSEAYKKWIRTLPSVVSGMSPCEACHTGVDGGTGLKASDLSCLPLTAEEHAEYHRGGKLTFAAKYGLDAEAEVERLNAEWSAGRKR